MEVLYTLLILLLVTRVFGEVAIRLGQPALVGELVSGILLGMLVRHYSGSFPVLSGLTEDSVFRAITDLGVLFLMLLAGLEMRPRDLAKASGGSLLIALSGLLLPLATGFGLGWMFLPDSEYKAAQALFVGTALSITAVPVAVKVLMDLGQLNTRAGKIIVSAAVFDDILSLIVLAFLTALIKTGGVPGPSGLLWLAGRAVAFFAITVGAGWFLFAPLGRQVKKLKSDELEFSFLLVVTFGFAVLAEILHLHFIVGAFMAGLFFGRQTIDEKTYEAVTKKVSAITTGFFAPIFFASIGLHLELGAISGIPVFLSLLVVAAFVTKLIGAGIPALMVGLSKRAALAVGMAMSARGAVELIIADIAKRAGLFDHPDPSPPVVSYMFSAVVIVAVTTTLAVPVVLRPLFAGEDKDS